MDARRIPHHQPKGITMLYAITYWVLMLSVPGLALMLFAWVADGMAYRGSDLATFTERGIHACFIGFLLLMGGWILMIFMLPTPF